MFILKILVCLIGIFAAAIAILILRNAPVNSSAMNSAVNTVLTEIRKHHTVTEKDCGEYKALRMMGIMKFHVRQYEVSDIGNLAVMCVNIGLMQMVTLVLTPVEKDLPLVSMDYMYMLNRRTCYLEFYDLVFDKTGDYTRLMDSLKNVRQKHSSLEDVIPSSGWYDTLKTEGIYKKGTRVDDKEFIRICEECFREVMAYANTLPMLKPEQHTEKAKLQKTYSDGLIANGGVSTDLFVKQLGAEKTKDFFDKVLFKAE